MDSNEDMRDPLNLQRHRFTKQCMSKGVLTSCFNCDSFKEAEAVCKRFDAKPPPYTLAVGCEFWEDGLPF